MTTLYASLHELAARVPSLDWLHSSMIVNDALGFLGDALTDIAPALDWIDGLPLVGHVLVKPFFDIYVLIGMELGLLGALLTAVVMVGSGALHALVESRVNSIAEFFDALQLFARLVRGS
jgi:hypothetical protein